MATRTGAGGGIVPATAAQARASRGCGESLSSLLQGAIDGPAHHLCDRICRCSSYCLCRRGVQPMGEEPKKVCAAPNNLAMSPYVEPTVSGRPRSCLRRALRPGDTGSGGRRRQWEARDRDCSWRAHGVCPWMLRPASAGRHSGIRSWPRGQPTSQCRPYRWERTAQVHRRQQYWRLERQTAATWTALRTPAERTLQRGREESREEDCLP